MTELKFYRVAKKFTENGRKKLRNVGPDLSKFPIVFDEMWKAFEIYYAARAQGQALGLSVLELKVRPVGEVTPELSHYVIEFEGSPQYKPRLRHEYRARHNVDSAISRSMDFSQRINLYGVEQEKIIRPESAIRKTTLVR